MARGVHLFRRYPYFWSVLAGVGSALILGGLISLIHRPVQASPRAASARSIAPLGVAPMQVPPTVAVQTLEDLVDLSGGQLDALYRGSVPGPVPPGRVRGVALYPDARFPKAKSRAAKLAWQGKVFDPESGTAVNRFFGLKVIRGRVYTGESWLDGGPALILDYQGTSTVYGDYRDEIRQVAPGVYLGLMYNRTTNPPAFKMYFAFTDR